MANILSSIRHVPFYATTVASGEDVAAEINNAIYAASRAAVAVGRGTKRAVRLNTGEDYYLESPIIMRSYAVLDCNGANLIPTYTGAADTLTNYVVGIDGASNPAMSTTLTTNVLRGASSITVTAAGTIAAGNYILITEAYGVTMVLSEIVQVASTYTTGTTIPLAWPTRQEHIAAGCTVVAWTPVIGAEVWSPRIYANEDSVIIANGILARKSLDITLDDVHVTGCSRMGIEVEGVKGYQSRGFKSLGTNNGWTQLVSVIDGNLASYHGTQGTARIHASGIPRYPIALRSECVDITLDDIHLTGTCCGAYVSGGTHIDIKSLDVSDVEITTAVYDRMVVGGEIMSTAPIALGFGTGYGPLDLAGVTYDLKVSHLRCENLRAPNASPWTTTPHRAMAIYLHDTRESQIGAISAVNRGDATVAVSGVRISDFMGHIKSIHVGGFSTGLMFDNSANQLLIDEYVFNAVRGTGETNAGIPFYLNYTDPAYHRIHLGRVWISNSFSCASFAGGFGGAGDFRIGHLIYDSGQYGDVIIGKNESGTSFSQGDVVEIDPSFTTNTDTRIITPAAASGYQSRLAAVASGGPNDSGTGYMFISPLPSKFVAVKATTAAVAKGDLIEYSGTRRCAANASAAHPFGRSMTYKAAGAEGIISVAPVIP